VIKLFIILSYLLYAQEESSSLSPARLSHLIQKGKKISQKVCDENKLSHIKGKDLIEIYKQLDKIEPCIRLNKRNIEALSYFLISKKSSDRIERIVVPKDSRCPVCGMFINKYPKWVALMQIDGKVYYFDGVKDMMKYYIFDSDFPYHRDRIREMKVTDFYTLKEIDAKDAFYVLGSNVYGPMGDELVPFEKKEEAKNFMREHNGDKMIQFKEITPNIVMALDGIEYND